MTIDRINKYIKDCMQWNYTDLFYAFSAAKGIEYPEDDLTDEEYVALEEEFCQMVTYDFLRGLVDRCCEDVDERMRNAFF